VAAAPAAARGASSSAAVGAVALDLRSRFGRVHKAVAAFRQRQPLAGDIFIRRRAAPDGLHVHFKHLANAARDQAGDDHDDRNHRPRTFPHGLARLGKAQILVAGGQVLGSTDVPIAVAELA